MSLQRGLGWALAVAAIVIAALAVRCQRPSDVITRDGLSFYDNDTVRRLERLRAIEASADYPVTERKDGYPAGCVSHWTLPMDWTIRALDPLASRWFAGARRNEAGAAVAGPTLAALSILVLCLGVRTLLGPGFALLAGLFYAFAYSVVNVSWFGNGDHQNVQHFLLVGFLMAGLLVATGRGGTLLALISGACLGGSIWVSTESMLMFYLWVAALGTTAVILPPTLAGWRTQIAACAGLLAAMTLGLAAEHDSWSAFEIDKISWFQLYQALVWTLFVSLALVMRADRRGRLLAAAGLALVAGLAPLAATGLGDAISRQVNGFETVNVWLQHEVAEFRNLFEAGGTFSVAPAFQWFSFLIAGLPLFVAGTLFTPLLTRRVRGLIALLAAGTFGLSCWEVKLAHMFALVHPLVLLLGAHGLWSLARRGTAVTGAAGWTFAAVLTVAALTSLPEPYGADAQRRATTRTVIEIAEKLKTHSRGDLDHSVLAPWDQAAHLMYYGDQAVVGSGYHRNIRGILDGNRLFFAQPHEDAQMRQLLRARGVRFVVAWWSKGFLLTGSRTLGRTDLAVQRGSQVMFSNATKQTLFWRLRYGAVEGFTLIDQGQAINVPGTGSEPIYKIFRFTP